MRPAKRFSPRLGLITGLLVLLCPIAGVSQHAKVEARASSTHSFAVIGDQPYKPEFESELDTLLQKLDKDPNLSWILHVGDIKGGGEPCSDELINKRLKQLMQIKKPLILIPGDNEWTDCHRKSNGSHQPLERLNYLRGKAFLPGGPLTAKANPAVFQQVRTQAEQGYPEHQLWTIHNTLFVTLNIPGSNNNLEDPKSPILSKAQVQEEHRTRMQAVKAWLEEARAELKAKPQLTEVVVAMQGNPIDGPNQGLLASLPLGPFKQTDGYAELRAQLFDLQAVSKRPLLLVHGDTHRYRQDRAPNPMAEGLSLDRLEAWGHPFTSQWVKVTVHGGEAQPFYSQSLK